MARSVVPEAMLSTANRIDRPEQDFWVYSFLIPKSPLTDAGTKDCRHRLEA